MEDQILQFYCGCRFNKSELKYKTGRVQKDGSYSRSGYKCPKCDTWCEFKISYCIECDIEILNERPSGRSKIRCAYHAEKRLKKKVKVRNAIRMEKEKKGSVEKVILKKERIPIKVLSLNHAVEKNIICIPLQSLFSFRAFCENLN